MLLSGYQWVVLKLLKWEQTEKNNRNSEIGNKMHFLTQIVKYNFRKKGFVVQEAVQNQSNLWESSVQCKGTGTIQFLVWRTDRMSSGWGNWGCLVWRKGGWVKTFLFSETALKEAVASWGMRFFSLVISDRTTANSLKLHQRRFTLDIRKKLFTKRVLK